MKKKTPNMMTPFQVYSMARKRAKEAGVSLRAYCLERGVNHSTVCKWKDKKKGSVFSEILGKLFDEKTK